MRKIACFFMGLTASLWLFSCSFDASGLKKLPPGCGNGVIENSEACDDANRTDGDGCSSACTVEEGWNCTDVCTPVCGDGRMVGNESCDDGNTRDDDGCDARCRVEPGWYCDDLPSVCSTQCGDGVKVGAEQCDDDNRTAGDGCDDLCRVETGFSCEGTNPSVCTAVCGDNLVVGEEVCDGVNMNAKTCQSFGFYQGTLGCMSDCRHFDMANCTRRCGDGFLDDEFGEECDTNAFSPDDTCVAEGYPGGTLSCSQECKLDPSTCHTWLEIAAGDAHTCALRSDHTVWCWGDNSYGQAGKPTSTLRFETPQQITAFGADVSSITAGYNFNCAIQFNGSLRCWGENTWGQLGNGQTTTTYIPVQVRLDIDRMLENVIHAAAGQNHACAVTSAGAVYCWGLNSNGQLGDGTYNNRSYATAVLQLATGATMVSLGRYHTCALRSDQTVMCWGSNSFGQLASNVIGNQTSPDVIQWMLSPAPALSSVECGEDFTCVTSTTGNAYCFGANMYGQLGDNSLTNRARPAQVVLPAQRFVQRISGGAFHTCALLDDESLACWGYNGYGRLGDGTTENRLVPTFVLDMGENIGAVSAGGRHTCAVRAGKAYCWGLNSSGQLGNNSFVNSLTPAAVYVEGMN